MPACVRHLLPVLLLAVAATGCGADEERLELGRDELGEQWPLTVERGTLACADRDLTITVDGAVYALGPGGAGTGRGRPLGELHAVDEELPGGARKSLGPLLSRALELC